MKNFLVPGVLALALCAPALRAEVIVRVAPPAPIVEHPGPLPSPRHVWVGGYHRWDGHHYVWVPGYYAIPPRPRAVWVPPHYDPRPGGYIFVPGHWA
jgi:hypothetical protein